MATTQAQPLSELETWRERAHSIRRLLWTTGRNQLIAAFAIAAGVIFYLGLFGVIHPFYDWLLGYEVDPRMEVTMGFAGWIALALVFVLLFNAFGIFSARKGLVEVISTMPDPAALPPAPSTVATAALPSSARVEHLGAVTELFATAGNAVALAIEYLIGREEDGDLWVREVYKMSVPQHGLDRAEIRFAVANPHDDTQYFIMAVRLEVAVAGGPGEVSLWRIHEVELIDYHNADSYAVISFEGNKASTIDGDLPYDLTLPAVTTATIALRPATQARA